MECHQEHGEVRERLDGYEINLSELGSLQNWNSKVFSIGHNGVRQKETLERHSSIYF